MYVCRSSLHRLIDRLGFARLGIQVLRGGEGLSLSVHALHHPTGGRIIRTGIGKYLR